jgi:hypothetical protein
VLQNVETKFILINTLLLYSFLKRKKEVGVNHKVKLVVNCVLIHVFQMDWQSWCQLRELTVVRLGTPLEGKSHCCVAAIRHDMRTTSWR